MIQEREGQMTDEELNNPIYFPKYLVVRGPIEDGYVIEEWQGFVKDIKNHVNGTTQ